MGDEAPRRRRVSHASVLQHRLAPARTQVGGRRSLVVAHAFVAGGAGSDSERELSVGGVDRAPTGALDGFTYAALGHLHRPQSVGRPNLRYSGTPLAYSFSETEAKTVTIVDLPPIRRARHHCWSSSACAAACGRSPGHWNSCSPTRRESAEDAMGAGRLTDRDVVLEPMARLRRRFPFIVELQRVGEPQWSDDGRLPGIVAQSVTPLDLAVEFWESTASESPSGEIVRLLANAQRRWRRPMRPLRLTLRAFGSFPGEETIDFEALAPLGAVRRRRSHRQW